jgi:hypothetical protein
MPGMDERSPGGDGRAGGPTWLALAWPAGKRSAHTRTAYARDLGIAAAGRLSGNAVRHSDKLPIGQALPPNDSRPAAGHLPGSAWADLTQN